MFIYDRISVNLIADEITPQVEVVQGDTGRGLLVDIGTTISGSQAYAYVDKADGHKVFNNCSISGSVVTVEYSAQMLAAVGMNYLQIMITENSQRVTTFDIPVLVKKSRVDNSAIESTDEYKALEELIDRANEAADRANEAADRVGRNIVNARIISDFQLLLAEWVILPFSDPVTVNNKLSFSNGEVIIGEGVSVVSVSCSVSVVLPANSGSETVNIVVVKNGQISTAKSNCLYFFMNSTTDQRNNMTTPTTLMNVTQGDRISIMAYSSSGMSRIKGSNASQIFVEA